MRLVEWACLYALVGVGAAVAIARRTPRPAPRDVALVVLLWPVYLPVLVATPAHPGATGLLDEHARLGAAIDAVEDPAIARLLPTRAQLAALRERLSALDARVRALDAALSRESPPDVDDRSVHSEAARRSLERLVELRDRARFDRDDLAGLVRRLRVQITVIGFSGAAAEDARDVAAELAARVDGVGAAFDPHERSATADERA